jgi:hypothetical protein
MRAIQLFVSAVIVSGIWSCAEERVPDRCSKVYVIVKGEDVEIREYQQYIPRAQDWAYYQTDILVKRGDEDVVYTVNKNIYMNRARNYVEIKGVVSHDSYLTHCADARSITDTVYLLIDEGKDVLTEYVVKDRSTIKGENGSRVRSWLDGRSNVMDAPALEQGTWTQVADKSILLEGVSKAACLDLRALQIASDGDTTSMSYIEGIGPVLYTKPSGREIRLEPMSMAKLTAEACK